ncbi:MAG: hypothetical protein DMG80_13465 [Acidobacteria bacterium]|nr:MAG: hypothetical protein DMG80_13465 [Acidobacteriota bacterium]
MIQEMLRVKRRRDLLERQRRLIEVETVGKIIRARVRSAHRQSTDLPTLQVSRMPGHNPGAGALFAPGGCSLIRVDPSNEDLMR